MALSFRLTLLLHEPSHDLFMLLPQLLLMRIFVICLAGICLYEFLTLMFVAPGETVRHLHGAETLKGQFDHAACGVVVAGAPIIP